MVTVGDVYDVAREKFLRANACCPRCTERLAPIAQRVGEAIAEERGIAYGETKHLTRWIVLGPQAEAAFHDLCTFSC